MESRESCLAADGRAWKVDGRAQALVGPGLATPLAIIITSGMIWTPYYWLTKGYYFYMAAVVIISGGHCLRIEQC